MSFEQAIKLITQINPIEVLKNPQANPQLTVAVLGMLALSALILLSLGILIFFIVESYRMPKGKRITEQIKRIRRKISLRTLLIELGVASIVLSAVLSFSLYYTSQPSLCKSCHIIKADYQSWTESSHKEVGCLTCHSKPGITSFLTESIKRLNYLAYYVKGPYRRPLKAEVSNEACLRCHEETRQGILVSRTIRVSHKEILTAGYLCTDCHNTVAHGKTVTLAKFPTMDKCVACHKGKSASAKCSTCHVKDIGKQVRRPKREFPKVRIAEITNCRGCHPIEKCTQCHGAEMPHQPEWMGRLAHARQAAFEKKQVCFNFCHDLSFCNRCHRFSGFYGHYAGWKQDHARLGDGTPATPAKIEAGCMGCHTPAKSPIFCALCH